MKKHYKLALDKYQLFTDTYAYLSLQELKKLSDNINYIYTMIDLLSEYNLTIQNKNVGFSTFLYAIFPTFLFRHLHIG